MQTRLLCTALALSLPVHAGDGGWTRFRGPNGTGVADDTRLPNAFEPEEGAAWRTEILPGYSSPVLTDDCVYLTGAEGKKELFTFCVDRKSGEVRWKNPAPGEVGKPKPTPNSPVSPTPATDGTNAYVFFESFGVVSYDPEGEERWRHELDEFATPYGMGTSPVLAGDTLLLQCDQDVDSYLLALDRNTGKELWKTPRAGFTHGFSTPVIYTPEEGPAEVITSGAYQVAGYSLETGEKLWWVTGMAWQAKSTPTVAGDRLYVHSWMASPTEFGVKKITQEWEDALDEHDISEDGAIQKDEVEEFGLKPLWFLYDLNGDGGLDEEEWGFLLARATAENGLYAIQLGGRGNVTESHVLWRYKRSLPNIPSPLLYDGVLYVLKEEGIFYALNPEDGELLQSGRVEGAEDAYYASPVAADGKIVTASAKGFVAVLKAGSEWEVLSVNDFDESIWATPALGGDQVFIRTQKALYCFETGGEG